MSYIITYNNNNKMQEEALANNAEDEQVFNCASFAVNYSGISNMHYLHAI